MRYLLWSLILGLFFFSAIPSKAAVFYYNEKRLEILITGIIYPGDDVHFLHLSQKYPTKGVDLVDSPGGDWESAKTIGEFIHKHGLYTYAVGECNSSCSYIWLAGYLRFYEADNVTMVQHLPNLDDKVDLASFTDVAYYFGLIGETSVLADAIFRQAHYYSNDAFDFIPMVSQIDGWNVRAIHRETLKSDDVNASKAAAKIHGIRGKTPDSGFHPSE